MPYSSLSFIIPLDDWDVMVKIKNTANNITHLLKDEHTSVTISGRNVILKNKFQGQDTIFDFISTTDAAAALPLLENALDKAKLNRINRKETTRPNPDELEERQSVFLSDIWLQSNIIPTTAPIGVNPVVELVSNLNLSVEVGTYNFVSVNLVDIIPPDFGDGSYAITLQTFDNVPIPLGWRGWYVNLESNKLVIRGGFTYSGHHIVNETHAPQITFYKYIGTKGVGGGGSSELTYEFYPLSDNQTVFVLPFTPSSIIAMYINGVYIVNDDTSFTISGATLTWLNVSYNLFTDDDILIVYD